MPRDSDFVSAYASDAGCWQMSYDGGVATLRGKFYGSYFSLPEATRNDPTRRFRAITAPVDGSPNGYTLHAEKGETYTFTKPA